MPPAQSWPPSSPGASPTPPPRPIAAGPRQDQAPGFAALTALLDSAHRTSSTPRPSLSVSSTLQPVSTSAFHASASHYANILQHPAFTPLTLDPKSNASTIPTALRRLQALLLQDDPNASAVEACLGGPRPTNRHVRRRRGSSRARSRACSARGTGSPGCCTSGRRRPRTLGRLALRSDPARTSRAAWSCRRPPAPGRRGRGHDGRLPPRARAGIVALRFVLSVFDGDAARTPDECVRQVPEARLRVPPTMLAHPEAAGRGLA